MSTPRCENCKCKTCNVKIQEESRVFFDVMLLVILSWGLAYYIVWTIPDIPAYITVLTYDSPDCKPGTLRSVENFPRSVCVVNENSIGTYELDVSSELLLPHTRTEAGWSRNTDVTVNNLNSVGSNFDNTFVNFIGENTLFAHPVYGTTFSRVSLGGRIIQYSLNVKDDQQTQYV